MRRCSPSSSSRPNRRRRPPAFRGDIRSTRARADVRVGDLRGRRFGPHPDGGARHSYPPRAGHRAGRAPDLRGRDRGRPPGHSRRAPGRGDRQRARAARRSARRCAAIRAHRGRAGARQRVDGVHHQPLRVLCRRRVLPREAPGIGGQRRGRAQREAQGRRRRQLPDCEPLLRQSDVLRLRRTGTLGRGDRPIIPGIMPVTNVGQITRFTSKIGATIPEPLLDALRLRESDPDAVLQLGVAWATLQCAELLAGGAPGVHFFTMNRSPATRAILSALRAARPWDRVRSATRAPR